MSHKVPNVIAAMANATKNLDFLCMIFVFFKVGYLVVSFSFEEHLPLPCDLQPQCR